MYKHVVENETDDIFSDYWYFCDDIGNNFVDQTLSDLSKGDDLADIAFGRFPVLSLEDLKTMITVRTAVILLRFA